jgi:hypothetical protein
MTKLMLAYDLMTQDMTFQTIADSGILDGSSIKKSGTLDLMIQLESDAYGSKAQLKDMAKLLGVSEEQMN